MATISLTSTTNLPEDWKKFRCLSPDRTSRSDIDRTGLELHRETITDLLEDRVRSRPQDVAIDSYDSQISYSQLRDMVNTMAKRLWDGGIRRSHRVGMCFHLSARAIIVILANLRLGATVVPVVPLHPRSRRLRMLQEAQASIIVVEDSGMIEELAESDIPVFDISSNQFLPAPATRLPMDTRPKTEDAAFVAFTSGSTGKPKGIVQSHEAIVTMSKALARELSVDSSARVAQFHPYIFDVAIMEITMCLITGAVLCIAKKKDMMLPCLGEVEEQLTAFRVTHVTLSPTMLNTMQPEKLSTVRVMSVMGGPLGRRAVQTWTRDWGGTFFQLWGCTEATILQSITSPMKENDKPLSIGKAIEGVCRLWVVDPANIDQLLPVGKEGELIVESRALASGYINDATATEKCFLSSPNWKYGSSKGQFYRTGDLVRREPNGSIIFVGRLDDQVNYHGERIELGEIDYYLQSYNPFKSQDIFADFHAALDKVVGFICGHSGLVHAHPGLVSNHQDASVQLSGVKQLVRKLSSEGDLPSYMIPHYCIPLARRPLTVSGKTDRKTLKHLMTSLSEQQWASFDVSST